MRGGVWSDETIQKGLKLRLACGTRGYDLVKQLCAPLPSERTLQRRLEDVKFLPGVLNEVLQPLALKVATMSTVERHACLMIDEMSITPGLDYDNSSKTVIGIPTLKPSSASMTALPLATHALVFMLGGISSRWKQTVAYHFTAASFDAEEVKTVCFQIIEDVEKIGIIVDTILSDMGGNNQALWRACGIVCGKFSRLRNSCDHPCGGGRQLFFMADTPHILKNIRNHLTKGQTILIPEEYANKYKLPTREVKLGWIKDLLDLDKTSKVRLAPGLNEKCLQPSHFDKMKLGLACRLLDHSVAAAIRFAVETEQMEAEALTTAWFIEKVCAPYTSYFLC